MVNIIKKMLVATNTLFLSPTKPFDRMPDIVIIKNATVTIAASYTSSFNTTINVPMFNGESIACFSYRSGGSTYESTFISTSWVGNTLSWYTNNAAADMQFNVNNRKYNYCALMITR